MGQRKSLVLFVTVFGERLGGSDNVLWALLQRLDRNRFEVVVVFLGDGGFAADVEALGIRVERVDAGRMRQPVRLAGAVRRLTAIFRRERPDLIVNWLSTAQVYGGPAALAAGMRRRVVWWQHDLNRPGLSRGRALDRLATLIPAKAVGACSDAVAEVQRAIRPRRPAFAVLAGVDDASRSAADGLSAADLGIPEGRLVIGTIGRLFAWKGHHRLAEAVAMLAEGGSDVHLLIVGGGGHRPDEAYRARLDRALSSPALRGRVTMTGQVPDATAHLAAMDIFVSASEGEPFGLVLLEAMAMEVPVVAVAQGGPPEIVEDGVSGLLVPTGSPADLAAAIGKLAESPQMRQAIGKAGRARWQSRFTTERMTADFERAIGGLVDD